MNIGQFEAEQLSEGTFEVSASGSIRRAEVDTKPKVKMGENPGFSRIALDPLLIRSEQLNVIVDAGLGIGLDKKERDPSVSNLHTNLEIFGLRPEDIDYVIITHLHYDHMAGLTYTGTDLETHPTLPNAEILIHQKEWDYAISLLDERNPVDGMGYEIDELYRLAADGLIHFIQDDYFELMPGLEILKTGGHTPGHQIVRITGNKETGYFCGDLVPNEFQLNQYSMKRADHDPEQTKKVKTLLLQRAFHEHATLFFYHSLKQKAGKLSKDKNRKYILQGTQI